MRTSIENLSGERVPSGFRKESMEIIRNQLKPIEINRNSIEIIKKSLEINGNQWKSMGIEKKQIEGGSFGSTNLLRFKLIYDIRV